jgi:rfaE bifunctional protein kinase chain/domain/rfaE bifunctional protein nucleotidyltransferase chain/domain
MSTAGKVLPLEALAEKIAAHRAQGKRVVLCHGVFDLLHIGHIRHFEQARRHGDLLVVTLTPDRFVNKGTNRPAFTELLRAETLASLGVVDYVAINRWPTAVETLRLLRPDTYCKGSEYRQNQVDAASNMLPEIAVARENGIAVEYTEDIVFSSSQLLNRHFSPFPPATTAWLEEFRGRRAAEEIIALLDQARALKVLVVGEAIIDEYVFCSAIGKSTKDPVLACQHLATEAFAGGSLAVANHLAGFCDQVGLITCLGEEERREDFIRQALLPNVQPTFVTKRGAPTIHKRRFVDQYSQSKLLELYVMDDHPLQGEDEGALRETLAAALVNCDLVVCMDYGHGVLTAPSIETLCAQSPFLAVNTQSNAGNRGFNAISKYRRADYVCLAHHEVAIETRMREGDLRDLLMEVTQRIDCANFTVTHGKAGSLHYGREYGFSEVPAFATQVVDRVGAGDAVIALTSLLVHQRAPWDIVGFVGNVAAAQVVAELGNRVPVGKMPLAKHIISLMK